jgi:hypothetical protein
MRRILPQLDLCLPRPRKRGALHEVAAFYPLDALKLAQGRPFTFHFSRLPSLREILLSWNCSDGV